MPFRYHPLPFGFGGYPNCIKPGGTLLLGGADPNLSARLRGLGLRRCQFPRTPFNRPISAYFSGVLSFLTAVTILTSRLARRSRRRRGDVSTTLRRNISRTCCVARRESIKLARSAEGGEGEDTALGVGTRCLG